MQPEKVAFQLKLGQSKPIYNAFKAIRESPEWDSLSDARKRIVECKFMKLIFPFIFSNSGGTVSLSMKIYLIPVAVCPGL